MVQRGLEFDLYQNSARKYLGFCIKMVRKGNKYLDLVLKWCEKCQRRRELLTVGGSIVGTDEVQSLVVMFGVVAILRLDLREKRLHSRILENTAIKSPLEC